MEQLLEWYWITKVVINVGETSIFFTGVLPCRLWVFCCLVDIVPVTVILFSACVITKRWAWSSLVQVDQWACKMRIPTLQWTSTSFTGSWHDTLHLFSWCDSILVCVCFLFYTFYQFLSFPWNFVLYIAIFWRKKHQPNFDVLIQHTNSYLFLVNSYLVNLHE